MIEILIPTYNRRKFLQQCIDSITKQNSHNHIFKILVVDNASPDDTEDYMKGIISEKIRYVRNSSNIGIEKNIIKCFEYSKEKYVMLMGDDDILYNTASDVLNSSLQKYKDLSVIVSSANVFVDRVDKISRKFYFSENRSNQMLISNKEESCKKFLLRGTLGSGIIYNRNSLDINALSKHFGSLYPQMYLMGKSMLSGNTLFLNTPFLAVRDENKKNWDYRGDYMNGSVIEIIKDICQQGEFKNETLNYIIKTRISVCHNFLLSSKRKSIRNFLKVFYSHFLIKEYRLSIRFWIFSIIIILFGHRLIFWTGQRIKKYFL